MTNGDIFTGYSGVFHNNFFAIDYDSKLLDRNFLVAYLKHPNVRHLMRTWSGATNIPDLNHGDFYAIPFPVPPIAEQQTLAQDLALIESSLTQLRKRLESTRHLVAVISSSLLES